MSFLISSLKLDHCSHCRNKSMTNLRDPLYGKPCHFHLLILPKKGWTNQNSAIFWWRSPVDFPDKQVIHDCFYYYFLCIYIYYIIYILYFIILYIYYMYMYNIICVYIISKHNPEYISTMLQFLSCHLSSFTPKP